MSPPEVLVLDGPRQAAHAGARLFAESARAAAGERGAFFAALSGGATPRDMHRVLAEEPWLSKVPWRRVCIVQADERLVPRTGPDSNFAALKADLLDRVPVSPENVLPMPVTGDPRQAAAAYEADLVRVLGDSPLDLVMLGLGPDGHTASLFAGSPALEENIRPVSWARGGNPETFRLTLTLPFINRARRVVFLAVGPGKAETVRDVIRATERGRTLPAFFVRPVFGGLTWILDKTAASLL